MSHEKDDGMVKSMDWRVPECQKVNQRSSHQMRRKMRDSSTPGTKQNLEIGCSFVAIVDDSLGVVSVVAFT